MKRVNMTHNVVDLYARQARQKADGVAGGRGFVSARRRAAWFSSYITTILQRDVRDIANVEGLVVMPARSSSCRAERRSLERQRTVTKREHQAHDLEPLRLTA